MTKRRIKNLCKFGVIFALILILLSNFLKVGNLLDGIRIRGFYMEPENSLDVVTLGASETYTSIAPGSLWKIMDLQAIIIRWQEIRFLL